jgi:hypothetical protein
VSADSAAAAEALFNEGRSLVAKGKYGEACPKFAESQRLDPASGTLMNLGDCYEKIGMFASAWATYREAVSEANRVGNKQRERDAKVLADRVEPKLSRLLVKVPEAHVVPGLQIKRDDLLVDRAQWGTYIPIDPGDHRVLVEAPGYAPWSAHLAIAEAARRDIEVPRLEALPEPPPQEDRGKSQRTLGFVVGGVGIAALAAGGVVGLTAMSLRSEAKDLGCSEVDCATSEAMEKNDSALGRANVSTVLFIAGGVVTAAGAILLLTAPSGPAVSAGSAARAPKPASRPSIAAGIGGRGVLVQGRF